MSPEEKKRLQASLARLSDSEREAMIALVAALVTEVVAQLSSAAGTAASRGPSGSLPRVGEVPDAARAEPLTAARTLAFDGAVLVEDDVLHACETKATRLTVRAATIISPLALDTARERGLTVERQGRSCC